MSFFGWRLPSQAQISEPAMLNKADQADRPAAELEGRDRPAEQRHADRLVGDVGRQMQLDEGQVETAHEEADSQEPEALGLERLMQRVLCALRNGRARRSRPPRSALLAQAQR